MMARHAHGSANGATHKTLAPRSRLVPTCRPAEPCGKATGPPDGQVSSLLRSEELGIMERAEALGVPTDTRPRRSEALRLPRLAPDEVDDASFVFEAFASGPDLRGVG